VNLNLGSWDDRPWVGGYVHVGRRVVCAYDDTRSRVTKSTY